MKILPDVGSMSRLTILSVVVLPHPDGPSSTQISPSATSKLTRSAASAAPDGVSNALVTLSSLIIAAVLSSMSPGDAGGRKAQAFRRQPMLDPEQEIIGEDREQADGKRAGDQLPRVGLRDAAADER